MKNVIKKEAGMSNVGMIIEERAADLGNFLVGRLLPFKQKRMIGPFIFIDHMGPAHMSEHENLDVAAHPHIGLSTLTYLFEGEIMHRDSLGNEVVIAPGAVNWMTAGRGVAHSERTPEALRNSAKILHGLQIWVALPEAFEQVAPSFQHYEAASLPAWQDNDVHFRLVAGHLGSRKSPVAVFSELYMLEIRNTADEVKSIDVGDELYGEAGMYILEGRVTADGYDYEAKQILVAKESRLCSFEIHPHTSVYIFGGLPFEKERFIFWNFVSSSKEVLEQAIKDWNDDKFPAVIHETERVPLPAYYSDRLNRKN